MHECPLALAVPAQAKSPLLPVRFAARLTFSLTATYMRVIWRSCWVRGGLCPHGTFDANVQPAPFARYTEIMLRPHRNWIVLILLSGCLGLPLDSPADPPDGYWGSVDSSNPVAFHHTRQVALKPRGNRLIRQDMHVRNIHRLDEFVGTSWIFGN